MALPVPAPHAHATGTPPPCCRLHVTPMFQTRRVRRLPLTSLQSLPLTSRRLRDVILRMEEKKESQDKASQPQKRMKVGIAYYSYTGNTKHVAQRIAKILEEKGCDTVLLDATIESKINASVLDGIDAFGAGAVTVAWREPEPMRRFLNSLPATLLKNKPAFVFATAGGNEGRALSNMASVLSGKGAVVVAAQTVIAPGNFSPWSPAKPLVSYWGLDDVAVADEFANKLYTLLLQPKAKSIWGTKSGYVLSWTYSFETSSLRDIEADPATCNKCYKCVKMCPTGALSISKEMGLPVKDQAKCLSCCRCHNICETNSMNNKKTKGKAQYVFSQKAFRPGKCSAWHGVKPDDASQAAKPIEQKA